MKVLIDYDNIPIALRNQGPLNIADRVFARLTQVRPACASLELRLYGGWDENWSMTKRAQLLNADLMRSFPRIMKSDSSPPVTVRLQAVLAQSLECLPRKLLRNTVRKVPLEKTLTSHTPSTIGCPKLKCPLDAVAAFVNGGACPEAGCNKICSMVISTVEQKLVDTMIVADMIHLGRQDPKEIAVVSSDDDMWPGIIMAMQSGSHVLHFQTSGLKQSLPYRQNVPGNYTALEL